MLRTGRSRRGSAPICTRASQSGSMRKEARTTTSSSATTSNLLARSVALLPSAEPTWLELVCELAIAERAAGRVDRACELLAEMITNAGEIDNRRLELRGQIELSNIRLHTGAGSSADELLELAS